MSIKNNPTNISIYCHEGKTKDDEDCVVLNLPQGKLRAAIIKDGEFIKWLGRSSYRSDVGPRRNAQNATAFFNP